MGRREVLSRLERLSGLVLTGYAGWLLVYSNVDATPDSGPSNCGPNPIRVLRHGPSRNTDLLGVGECRAAAVFVLSVIAFLFAVGIALSLGALSAFLARRARRRDERAAEALAAYGSGSPGEATVLALRKPLIARRRSELIVSTESLTVRAPTHFGRRMWTVPLDSITAFDETSHSPDRESADPAEFDPPVRLASLVTNPRRAATDVLLMFDPPQRIAPLKRMRGQMPTLGIHPTDTRRPEGLEVDGVHLQVEQPALTLVVLADAGVPVADDPIAWMDQRRPRLTDPGRLRSLQRRAVWRVLARVVAIPLLWIAWAVRLYQVGDDDPFTDPALILIVAGLVGAWLFGALLDRADRDRSAR